MFSLQIVQNLRKIYSNGEISEHRKHTINIYFSSLHYQTHKLSYQFSMEITSILLQVVCAVLVLLAGMQIQRLLTERKQDKAEEAALAAKNHAPMVPETDESLPTPDVETKEDDRVKEVVHVLAGTGAVHEEPIESEEEIPAEQPEEGDEEETEGQIEEAAEERMDLSHLERPIQRYCVEERHFTDPDLTIVDLARGIGTNRTYVWKFFCQQGTSFNNYINELRSDYAAELLRTTNQTVAEIGIMAGYRTTNTFIISFKKHFDCTPKQYQLNKKGHWTQDK